MSFSSSGKFFCKKCDFGAAFFAAILFFAQRKGSANSRRMSFVWVNKTITKPNFRCTGLFLTKQKNGRGCKYCDYADICGFDERARPLHVNRMPDMKDAKTLEKMCAKQQGGDQDEDA